MRSTTSSRQSRTRSGRKYADITDGMSTSIRNLKLTYASTLAPSETMEAQAAARWLALPAPTGVPESTLAPADGALFFDGHFPAGEESLYGRNATTPPGATPVAWSRLNGVLYDAKRHEHPIVRGSGLVSSAEESAPGGRGFHGALATVATREDLILDLIVSDDYASQGLFTFTLYKHGRWHDVSVDADIPVDAVTGEPLFMHGAEGELWPALLEKAYAKLHGGYHALENVDARCALVDLTGGTLLNVDLSDVQTGLEGDAVWPILRKQWAQGSLLCVTCDVTSARANGLIASGLEPGCAYPVLELRETGASEYLVRLANPFTASIWNGEQWTQSEAGAAALNELDIEFAPGDGTWWMPLSALCATFDLVTCCCLLPPHHHHIGVAAAWIGDCSGGPPGAATFCTNPHFQISVRKGGTVTVAISARDTCVKLPPLMTRDSVPDRFEEPLKFGCVVLHRRRRRPDRVWRVTASECIAASEPDTFREVGCSFEAEPGATYICVPFCSERGREGAFALRVISANPIEMTRLAQPIGLRGSAAWNLANIGGPLDSVRFASNPQWLLRIPRKTRVALLVEGRDNAGQLTEGAHGLLIATADRASDGPGRVNCLDMTSSDGSACYVVAGPVEGKPEASSTNGTQHASLVTTLPAGDYSVIAYQRNPAPTGVVLVSVITDAPADPSSAAGMATFPATCSFLLDGRWVDGRCGGSRAYSSWLQNPSFRLETDVPIRVRIALHRRRASSLHASPSQAEAAEAAAGGNSASAAADSGRPATSADGNEDDEAAEGGADTGANVQASGLSKMPSMRRPRSRSPTRPRRVPFVIDNLVGFYVLRGEPPSPKDNANDVRMRVFFESAFLSRECPLMHEVNVPAGVSTIIMTRFAPAEASGEGPDDLFLVEVGCNSPFHLEKAVTG